MEQVAILPSDLMEEILLRLPIESLLRLKRVSKQWLKLITSNRFAHRRHCITKAQNLVSFFVVPSQFNCLDGIVTPVSVDALQHSINVYQNINLNNDFSFSVTEYAKICVMVSVGLGFYYIYEKLGNTSLLWNPATRECCWLPKNGSPPLLSDWYIYHTSRHFCFGKVDYKDGNISYKVGQIVQLWDFEDRLRTKSFSIELYSSETKSWKLFPKCCTGEFLDFGDSTCVNLNGKAHWMMLSEEDEFNITTFDYETETIGRIEIRLAPKVNHSYQWLNPILSLWDETSLCLVLDWMSHYNSFLDIWVMHEYGVGNSWIKKFTIGPISQSVKVLAFSSKIQCLFLQPWFHKYTSLEKQIQVYFLPPMRSSPTTLRLCDLKSPKFKETTLSNTHLFGNFKISKHVESLFSVLN